MRKMIYAMCSLAFILWNEKAESAGAEKALDILDAPVSYTATYVASDSKGVFAGKVWHQPGRERRECETKHGPMSALLQRDQDAAYLINPAAKWVVAVSFHAAVSLAGGLDELVLTKQKIGPESVEGQKTIRYHLAASGVGGREFVGDLWALPSGVPVKVSGVETEPGGKKAEVSLIQTNIRVGPVNGAVDLEAPQGFMSINLRKVTPENLTKAIASLAPLLGGGGFK